MKPEVFGGKKKKNPILRYNDFVWDSVVGSPVRGAKNLLKIPINTLKTGVDKGYDLTDKLIGKKSFKYKSKTKPKTKTKTESKPKTESRPKTESKGTKPKTDEKSERAAWLKKTKNSPAARSGKFTAEERWQTHLKHRKWAANRGKKKRKPYGAMGRGQRR